MSKLYVFLLSIFSSMKLVVLGVTQDSGYPQIACADKCCERAWQDASLRNYPVSIALVNEEESEYYLFDVTPDVKFQLKLLSDMFPRLREKAPAGIFLTHAHIGHYTGLIHFSMEAMDSSMIPTYVMPRMMQFLRDNGPWSQLIAKKNIDLKEINSEAAVDISGIQVIPFLVPHRDEFSETAGFKIFGPKCKVLFIPDIDKWADWEKSIIEEVNQVDIAYLDGSFYSDGELARNMSKIKHPFVTETRDLFQEESVLEKSKIHFIHLNHTNPLLNKTSEEYLSVKASGYNVAELGRVIEV